MRTNPFPPNSVWNRVLEAVHAAQSWEGVDPSRLDNLKEQVIIAEGRPESLDPKDCRYLLHIVLDGRSTRFFDSDRRGGKEATLRGLRSLLQPRADLATQEGRTEKGATSTTSVDDQPARLRDYQVKYFNTTIRAMEAVASSQIAVGGTGPNDRGYLISPWQTGKSHLIAPLAQQARRIFPGKRILIISPFKVITNQMIGDLTEGFGGSIGVVDATRKEFDREAIVASAFTLKNHLTRLDPNEIGLVVVDEMTFIIAPTWRQILVRLGFIHSTGTITSTTGKFLLGLGATGERADGHHVREIFGHTLLAARGFNWFVARGYLHEPLGLEVSYGSSEQDWERIEEMGETIVVMRDSPENRKRLIETYQKNIGDGKALVFTARVQEANHLVQDFNATFGEGYAATVTHETPDEVANQLVRDFNNGPFPRVLISVRKLSIGARFRGVTGVLFNFQSSSWNQFAQSAGRGLARLGNESQRSVLIVTMEGSTKPLHGAQTAASLFGYYGERPTGKIYKPRLLRGRQKTITGVEGTPLGGRSKLAIEPEGVKKLNVRAFAFGQAMQQILEGRYGGDLMTMAERTGIPGATLDAYLGGILPSSYLAALNLGRRLRVNSDILGEAWLSDMRAFVSATYPLSSDMPQAKRGLIDLIREATFRRASEDFLLPVLQGERGGLKQLPHGFLGDLALREDSLRLSYQVIVSSGIDESRAKLAIGEFVAEQASLGRSVEGVVARPTSEADSSYIDYLDGEERVPLNQWLQQEERGATSLFGRSSTPEELLGDSERVDWLLKHLSTLSDREQTVLKKRFQLEGKGWATLEELAQQLGISREEVVRIEFNGVQRLRMLFELDSLPPHPFQEVFPLATESVAEPVENVFGPVPPGPAISEQPIYRLPATPENLARHGLLEPATVRGRAIRYLPGEGVAGLAAVFAAPVVTERLFQINPHRNPGGFHAANLGALHFLNATGGAIADVIPQIGRGVSTVRVGNEIMTSPSLGRTFLRSAGQRLIHVGGLAEGMVWAYPGYVAGDELVELVADNPTARAIGGGVGAIGVPVGLKIWLGEQGMSRLSTTAVGRAAGPVGAVLLAKDIGAGAYETMMRQDLEDREIALRERMIHELPWRHRQLCEWSEALFMSGVGIILGVPGAEACERSIAAKMDALDGGSRRQRYHLSPADRQQFRSRVMFPFHKTTWLR